MDKPKGSNSRRVTTRYDQYLLETIRGDVFPGEITIFLSDFKEVTVGGF